MKAMLIYNPTAGQRQLEGELRSALRFLEGRGWQVAWRQTLGPGDATTYAREAAAAGYDVALAAGGDGTIGQVVNGIAGTNTALGVIPVGTTNVWAREVGIPLTSPLHPHAVQDAVRLLADGAPREVDLGQVNGRYFLMWAGAGFDAQVTAQVEIQRPDTKRRLGMAAFALAALVQAFNLKGIKSTVIVDGKRSNVRALLIVVSNIQLYGGIVRIAPLAHLDDGLLDVCVFSGYTTLTAIRHILRALMGRHINDPQILYLQGQHVVITSARPMPVQVDGDVMGNTPLDIHIYPRSLKVLLPAHTVGSSAPRGSLVSRQEASPPISETLTSFFERIKR